MDWFEKHLNWTWILCGCLGAFVLGVLFAVFDFVLMIILEIFFSSATDSQIAHLLFAYTVGSLLVIIGVTVWYLKQKGRHMGNLAWIICPFGFIVLLCLDNKCRAKDPLSIELNSDL